MLDEKKDKDSPGLVFITIPRDRSGQKRI